LALAAYILAAALLVRWHRLRTHRTWLAAGVGIGIAASANYPGALLLLVLAWLEWVRAGDEARIQRLGRIARACVVAFTVFLALNPLMPARSANWDTSKGGSNVDAPILAEMLARHQAGEYVFPIEATYTMRMMTPVRPINFQPMNCAPTPAGL
jgi:4-amino-4-deoxy-L-arabinose transferase-like glycosyltransferase